MNLLVKDIIEISCKIIGILSILGGGCWALILFSRKKKLESFTYFIQYRNTLKSNPSISKIVNHVQNYQLEPELCNQIEMHGITINDFYYFLGFYEEISLLYQQNLISKKLAKDMFAWYAIKVADNDSYWWHFRESYITDENWKNYQLFVNEMR